VKTRFRLNTESLVVIREWLRTPAGCVVALARLLDTLGGRITIQIEKTLHSETEAMRRAAKSDRL
jgi:hypothetical protein